jgi:endonuclease-3 related protein
MIPFNLLYKSLLNEYGFQNWWPADTIDEMIIGSILTQNVSWQNVKKAIQNLKDQDLLSFEKLHEHPINDFSLLLKPTRFYNQKAQKLLNFSCYFKEKYDFNYNRLFNNNQTILRKELLSINGIGKETADSILLYAGNYNIFVIDAYTIRLLNRLGILDKNNEKYDYVQNLITESVENNITIYKDFHAQIVIHCNMICKSKPMCDVCILKKDCKKLFFN